MDRPSNLYLGDGVYASRNEVTGEVVLSTSNGISITNTIFLDGEVIEHLLLFLGATRDETETA
jgi:hypothetical protein